MVNKTKKEQIVNGILTAVSITGVVTTAILASKATIKAKEILDETELVDTLTIGEKTQLVWKPYIPAVISGITTIGCIVANQYLNNKSRAALIAAYTFLDRKYQLYLESTEEVLDVTQQREVRDKISQKVFNEDQPSIDEEDDGELFFSYDTLAYFNSDINSVIAAEEYTIDKFNRCGEASMGDFYMFLNLPVLNSHSDAYWSKMSGVKSISFNYDSVELDDGFNGSIPCTVVKVDEQY